jgi:stage V sporulation protein B
LEHSRRNSQSLLNGAMILTVAMVVVKVIGMLYKLPLANVIGMEGKGIFTAAFNLYAPVYGVAITGLPIAVARMVSERVALGKYRDVRAIHKVAARLFLLTGLAGLALLLLLAYPYARYFCTSRLDALPAIFAVAPSIFFCCAMSIYRGYYEGLRNMTPTAVSQVIEALCKLVLGLLLAWLVMYFGAEQYKKTGTVLGKPASSLDMAESMLYPWSAAAAIIGITVGTVLGFFYLLLRHRLRGDGITREMLINAGPAAPAKNLLREMIRLAIPMLLSSVILNVTNLIDTVNVQALLNSAVEKYPDVIERIYGAFFRAHNISPEKYADNIFGIYGTALDFRNLVPTIVTALGVSALPAISAAWALRKREAVQRTINTVLRISLMIALPAGFGMAVLSYEIPALFYEGQNVGSAAHVAPILWLFGVSTALMAVSAPITNMLQGIGRTDIPVKSLVVGVIIKIIANFILVGNPEINIKGAPIGSILCYVAIVAINLGMLLKVSRAQLNLGSVFLKPLFCAGLSAAAAWAVNGLTQRFDLVGLLLPELTPQRHSSLLLLLAVGLAVLAAVLVYVLSLLLTHAVTADDFEILPKGKKIAKALAKRGLLG